jgi:hypothetical protein
MNQCPIGKIPPLFLEILATIKVKITEAKIIKLDKAFISGLIPRLTDE